MTSRRGLEIFLKVYYAKVTKTFCTETEKKPKLFNCLALGIGVSV